METCFYQCALITGKASRVCLHMRALCVFEQHPTALCPPEYMVCFLHRLITAVRGCWDEGHRKSPSSVSSDGTTHCATQCV